MNGLGYLLYNSNNKYEIEACRAVVGDAEAPKPGQRDRRLDILD